MKKCIFREESDDIGRRRLQNEVALAHDFQRSGMSRSDALRAAAKIVQLWSVGGRKLEPIISIDRIRGDNGGPLLDDPS